MSGAPFFTTEYTEEQRLMGAAGEASAILCSSVLSVVDRAPYRQAEP
jgi:hypothetical protein